MAYGDAQEIEYGGERYCYFDDEVWIWRQGMHCWIALDTWPPFVTVINERIALVDEATGEYFCNCPRYILPQTGCGCGGK